MKVLPVNFSTDHKQMLAYLHILINKEYLAIPKELDKLIISLRTAYAYEYSLDREQTSYSDTLEALRLSCLQDVSHKRWDITISKEWSYEYHGIALICS